VARDGVEPPTPAFSALFRPNYVFNQQLNSSEWAIYCDHSVTSADVRLSVGSTTKNSYASRRLMGRFAVHTVQSKLCVVPVSSASRPIPFPVWTLPTEIWVVSADAWGSVLAVQGPSVAAPSCLHCVNRLVR
jgi:hypothetical protein